MSKGIPGFTVQCDLFCIPNFNEINAPIIVTKHTSEVVHLEALMVCDIM